MGRLGRWPLHWGGHPLRCRGPPALGGPHPPPLPPSRAAPPALPPRGIGLQATASCPMLDSLSPGLRPQLSQTPAGSPWGPLSPGTGWLEGRPLASSLRLPLGAARGTKWSREPCPRVGHLWASVPSSGRAPGLGSAQTCLVSPASPETFPNVHVRLVWGLVAPSV